MSVVHMYVCVCSLNKDAWTGNNVHGEGKHLKCSALCTCVDASTHARVHAYVLNNYAWTENYMVNLYVNSHAEFVDACTIICNATIGGKQLW